MKLHHPYAPTNPIFQLCSLCQKQMLFGAQYEDEPAEVSCAPCNFVIRINLKWSEIPFNIESITCLHIKIGGAMTVRAHYYQLPGKIAAIHHPTHTIFEITEPEIDPLAVRDKMNKLLLLK